MKSSLSLIHPESMEQILETRRLSGPGSGLCSFGPMLVVAAKNDACIITQSENNFLARNGGKITSIFCDDNHILVGTGSILEIWTIDGILLNSISHRPRINCCVVENGIIATGGDDMVVQLTELKTGFTVRLGGHVRIVTSVALKSQKLLTGSEDATIFLWDLKEKTSKQLFGHVAPVRWVGFLPDNRIASVGDDGTLRVWTEKGELQNTFRGHEGKILCGSISSQGLISTGGEDRYIGLWHPDKGLIGWLEGHKRKITDLSWGKDLWSCSEDRTMIKWDTNNVLTKKNMGHIAGIRAIALSEDGLEAVSASRDYTLKSWDIVKHECIATVNGHTGAVQSVAVWKNLVLSGSTDNTIRLWDNGICIKEITAHSDAVTCCAFSKNGNLISGGRDNVIRTWTQKGELIKEFLGHQGWVRGITTWDQYILSASYDKTIRLWNLITGKCIMSFEGHEGPVINCIKLPNNQIASGSLDSTVKIWDIENGKCIITLSDHKDNVPALVWTGSELITGSTDATIKRWDETWKLKETINVSSPIEMIVLKGKTILACDRDGNLLVYYYSTPSSKRLQSTTKWSQAMAI